MERSDWDKAYQLLIAEGRERLGGEPTPEEIMKLELGELSEQEAADLRERIALYPDLARMLAAPFPQDDQVAPVVKHPRSPLTTASHVVAVAAAAVAIVFGVLFFQTKRDRDRLAPLALQPQSSIENVNFPANVDRGPVNERRLSSHADYFLMIPAVGDDVPSYPDYRVAILDVSGNEPRVVWTQTGIRRRSDNSFEILVPRSFFTARKYQIVIEGLDGAASRELARYTFHYE